jgi:hypothetical protein
MILTSIRLVATGMSMLALVNDDILLNVLAVVDHDGLLEHVVTGVGEKTIGRFRMCT